MYRAAIHVLCYINHKMLIGCAFTRIHFEFRKAAGNKLGWLQATFFYSKMVEKY